jgi:hypothetical protein
MDPDDNELLILAQVGFGKFCLISLSRGNRYAEPSDDYYEVTSDCILICREAKITIEVKK